MATDANFSWAPILGKLVGGDDLTAAEAAGAMATILRGEADDAQIAGFSVGLRAKGETVDELTALVTTALDFSQRIELDGPLLDTCGTGGDRSGTFNISTAAAFVVAGAGARVVKHGNRAASSQCGSADVLEELGVVVDLGPAGVARCVEDAGIGFALAQRFHPAFRFAGPARKSLGIPTTFNFVGPLANPARASHQVVGVSDPAMAERMVGVLSRMDTERAFVFYGHDGLDELTTTTTSTIFEMNGDDVTHYEFDPDDYGFEPADPDALRGGDPVENAKIIRSVLAGDPGPRRDVVVLNAAAGLLAADVASNFDNAIAEAAAAIDDGLASERLDALVEVSREAAAVLD